MVAIEEEGSEAFTLGQCLRSEDQKPLRPLHILLSLISQQLCKLKIIIPVL